jgi:hypothetical protein
MSSNFSTDRQWFRSKDGSKLLAGSPLTLFTVSETGQAILDAIESDAPLVTQHQQLTERLIATGAIHPKNIAPCSPDQITVVIPAFISDEEEQLSLQTLIDALRPLRVVIVDDASPFFFEIAKTTMSDLKKTADLLLRETQGFNMLSHLSSSSLTQTYRFRLKAYSTWQAT